MLKKSFFVLLALACVLLSACSGRSSSGYACELPAPQVNPLTTVLNVSPEEIQSFWYNGNAPYYVDGTGGIFSKDGYSATEFSCPNSHRLQQSYLNQENALTKQFAEALAQFPVNAYFIEEMTAETELPQSDYMTFGLLMKDGRQADITVFETGDVYLTQISGDQPLARHYSASRMAYSTLKREIADIRTALDALPLDYQLEMGTSPDSFKPESTALRLWFENIGAQPVTCSTRFTVEKLENGSWQSLLEKEGAPAEKSLTVPPRDTGYYAVDLTRVEGAQEPGRYRVSNSFNAGAQQITLTAAYEISTDAFEVSRPYKPDMTPEQQDYYNKYLSVWGFYCPFDRDYTEQSFAQDFRPYLLYYSSAAQEGRREEYDKFGVDVPASVVEGTVTRHFPVTAEQFRARLAQDRKGTEYYDPQNDSYHFEGGYGGVGLEGVVTHFVQENGLVTLSCDWYDITDRYQFSHAVTIRLGAGADEFYYMKNSVTNRAKADS